MIYPYHCQQLKEEELVYTAGGSALDAFNYLFGDWFRDLLLSDIRNAVFGSMQQMSAQPAVDTGKKILGWAWPAQLAYGYGFYHLAKTVKNYWDQKS